MAGPKVSIVKRFHCMSHVTTCTYQAFPAFLYCKHENLGGDLGRRLAEVRVRSGWG